MTREDILNALGEGCFGLDLADRNVDRLAEISRLVEYPASHLIFREGSIAADIYIIVDGVVRIEFESPSGQKPIVTLERGELLGWAPILQQGQMTASARTLQPTRLVAIDVSELLRLFSNDPRLGCDFMRATTCALAKRLNGVFLQLADVYGP